MNKTAILTLAGLLENIPPQTKQGFNMDHYVAMADEEPTHVQHECRTTACMAGWATTWLSSDGRKILKKARSTHKIFDHASRARQQLGLDRHEASELFEPMHSQFAPDPEEGWGSVTPHQAAKVLRHLADTGEVDWEVAFDA